MFRFDGEIVVHQLRGSGSYSVGIIVVIVASDG